MRKENSIINRVANYVANYPGETGAEISQALDYPGAYRRLSEIKKLGLVKTGAKRKCRVSHKTADTWYPDDREPEIDRGEETKSQMKKRLEARIETLVNEKEQACMEIARLQEIIQKTNRQARTLSGFRD